MEKLDSLYQWLHEKGVYLFDRQLPFSNGATKALTVELKASNDYGIFLDKGRLKSKAEEVSALAHEAGHCATGATHELSSPFDLIEKHESKADKWAIERLVSSDELDAAVADGHTEIWDLAEHFGLTEDFMRKAVCWYTYGNLNVEHYMSY